MFTEVYPFPINGFSSVTLDLLKINLFSLIISFYLPPVYVERERRREALILLSFRKYFCAQGEAF